MSSDIKNPYLDPKFYAFQTNDQGREDWRLRLSLIKESVDYRKFWADNAEKCLEALSKIDNFYDTLPEGLILTKEDSDRFVKDCKRAEDTIFEFDRQLRKFDIGTMVHAFSELAPDWENLEPVWMALDPANEEIPNKMPFPFFELPAIADAVIRKDGRRQYDGGRQAKSAVFVPEELQPSHRVLVVDLSKKRGELIKEFKAYLEITRHMRTSEHCPVEWKENYDKWEPDKSRFRAESWQALKVWRLRRLRKTYREIARTLKIKESTAKMAFRRAYELIENRAYDPEMFKRENQVVRISEIGKTCETCPLRETCMELCPDVLLFVEQDEVTQRELCIEEVISESL